MKTYQDFLKAREQGTELDFIKNVINEYRSSDEDRIALDADEYEAERNITILQFVKWLWNSAGQKVPDFTAANNKICSNFFHRLTTQRVAYSLGNGVSFNKTEKRVVDGKTVTVDVIKEKLGKKFDTILYKAAHYARIHRACYLFWNLDHANYFKLTEFCPLFDEDDGTLRVGIRFWSLDWNQRPVTVVVYEEDGYTKYKTKKDSKGLDLAEYEPKRAYKQVIAHNDVDPDEIVSESNYSALPIVPLWGSKHRQSDLVGMRAKIDAFDLVKSGFANDLEECAEIYWIISNAMGEDDASLAKFRDRIKFHHTAVIDGDNTSVTPYTHEIPVTARDTLLKSLREQLYEDYGGLDVHTIAAGSTNDHIDAAYQPCDDEADDFEYQIIEAVQGILALIGEDDTPVFHRNRVSNQMEQTQMVMMCANVLDEETTLRKLPFITPDEVPDILARKQAEDMNFAGPEEEEPEEEEKVPEEEGQEV